MELLARVVVSVDSRSGDREDESLVDSRWGGSRVKFLVCSVISDWLMLILPENFIKFQKKSRGYYCAKLGKNAIIVAFLYMMAII